jgi:two-component system, sensor histidine kinase PdtaS
LAFDNQMRLLGRNIRDHAVAGYAIAAILSLIAIGIRFEADPYLPPGFPFLTFFPAVILATFVGGAGPGVVAGAIGFLASWYFFMPPAYSFAVTSSAVVALAFYLAIIGVDIAIIDRLMATSAELARQRANALRLADEKKTLFVEVQHRIGNNLQAISSLLQIQSRTVADEAARKALVQSMQRVAIVADIQRRFHNPDEAEGLINTGFVEGLAQACLAAAGKEEDFAIACEVEEVRLPQDEFLAVSLILTECINNVLEHGAPADGRGSIRVTISREGRDHVAAVADSGRGLPDGFDLARQNSIGLKVIQAFARQLKGRFEMTSAGLGTVCRLTFPMRSDESAGLGGSR